MRPRALAVVFALMWAGLPAVWAQRAPRIGYVYPAGGRQNTTFTAVIGGQYLNNPTSVHVTPADVSATILDQERQLTPKEQLEAKEMLSKFQEKRKNGEMLTPEEKKAAGAIKEKLTAFGRRLANPALGEFVTVQMTVPASATPGKREVRLQTPGGLSNPMSFHVGQLPEFSKPDWKSTPRARNSMDPAMPKTEEIKITLPATLNGQIPPGGVDKYRFPARAGQSLLVSVSARELIPYLADAVPGWFQAAVTLYDATGNELAYADDFRFHPDPVFFYKIPKDGEYVLEIKDALYRGREDFVYRITVGELPFVTSVFPLGGKTGTLATVAVSGWNLPYNSIALDLRGKALGTYPFAASQLSNRVPIGVDNLPEIFEVEPNDTASTAQTVTLPVIINGRVGKPGDWDVFKFEGKAGDRIVAEVYARRLDSPLDSILILTDAAGSQLALNDDHEDKGSGLNTHHADSYLSFTLPVAGTYFIHIGDTQHCGGEAFAYRLRLSAPRPDFELRAVPSTLNVRAGASAPVTVYALRKDGFEGEIALSLKDPPTGFTLASAIVPANQDQVKSTLSAATNVSAQPLSLKMEGRATIQNRTVVHEAVPADDMMQAFAYRHLVPADTLQVAVVGRFRPRDSAKILTATPVHVPAGGTVRLEVSMPAGPFTDTIQYELNEAPEGVAIQTMTPTSIVLQADAAKVKPGQKGNLIILASIERPAAAGKPATPANQRRIPLGALPAVPFEIIRP